MRDDFRALELPEKMKVRYAGSDVFENELLDMPEFAKLKKYLKKHRKKR
jgi:hypothetical protein